MRSYLELDMYASLTVHTDVTIALGREELLRFDEILRVSIELILIPSNLRLSSLLRQGISPKKSIKKLGLSKGAYSPTHVS